jgi:hypothetical protein
LRATKVQPCSPHLIWELSTRGFGHNEATEPPIDQERSFQCCKSIRIATFQRPDRWQSRRIRRKRPRSVSFVRIEGSRTAFTARKKLRPRRAQRKYTSEATRYPARDIVRRLNSLQPNQCLFTRRRSRALLCGLDSGDSGSIGCVRWWCIESMVSCMRSVTVSTSIIKIFTQYDHAVEVVVLIVYLAMFVTDQCVI